MKNLLSRTAQMAIATLCVAVGASAANINVLWYTAGTTDGGNFIDYQAGVTNLASKAPAAPGANTWAVTFWTGGAVPSGNYNVLVVASPEFDDGSDYTALSAATINLGDRVMITGLDGDWHYMNFPGAAAFNGPQGFLLDSINWAGSGIGMGAVLLQPVSYTLGLTGLGSATGGGIDSVLIPATNASYPINTNITSNGLSNWGVSAHESWTGFNTGLWTGINQSGSNASQYITLVSAATADGGLNPVPEPTTLLTLGGGLLGLGMWHRRRSAS